MEKTIKALILLAKEIYTKDGEEATKHWLNQFYKDGYRCSIYARFSYTKLDEFQTCGCADHYRDKTVKGEGWCMTWKTETNYTNYITLAIYKINETTS